MSFEENKEAVSLSAEQQQIFDADVANLQKAGKEAGIAHLEGRVKFGLDPAGMMLLPETAPLTAEMSEKLGVDQETVLDLIKELHKRGPWEFAERLKDGSEPEIKAYIAMASMCHEKGWPGYEPNEYLDDRARVIADLGAFDPAKMDAYRQDIKNRVKDVEDKTEVIDGKEVKVAIVSSDSALPLSMDGFKGCVVRDNNDHYAQTSNISDALLQSKDLAIGFGEVYDAKIGGHVRVPKDTEGSRKVWVNNDELSKPLDEMKPSVKRIFPGYVLTYEDEALALDLVKTAVQES